MKKRILVTGASRGIGRSIAIECAKAGYDLIITCCNQKDKLEEVAETCREYQVECMIFVGDLGDYHVVEELFGMIETECGGVDVLVNNAGISYIGLVTDMKEEQWQQILGVNLSSVFYCCKLAVPYMVRKKQGKIINISSIWGNVGASCEVAYSATKGGVNSLTKALAKELAPSNVQVNALALGVIDTEMNQGFSEEEKQALVDEIPAGRMGYPQEIGEIIVSMLEGQEYLTGQIITVDGGLI